METEYKGRGEGAPDARLRPGSSRAWRVAPRAGCAANGCAANGCAANGCAGRVADSEALLSTRQALQVVRRRFPLLTTIPQFMHQVRAGVLPVAATHGKKYYFDLQDLMTFEPRYRGQGRNRRPPVWQGRGFTLTEAAELTGIPRRRLVNMYRTKRLQVEMVNGVYCVSGEEIERLRKGGA